MATKDLTGTQIRKPRRITQALLQRYVEAKAAKDQAEKNFQRLVAKIGGRLKKHVKVEPGRLAAYLSLVYSVPLTQKDVMGWIGRQSFDEMRAGIPQQVWLELYVTDREEPQPELETVERIIVPE